MPFAVPALPEKRQTQERQVSSPASATPKPPSSGDKPDVFAKPLPPPPPKFLKPQSSSSRVVSPPTASSEASSSSSPSPSSKVASAPTDPTPPKQPQHPPQRSLVPSLSAQQGLPQAPPLKYQKPTWSGFPNQQFSFEVIKNGTIVEKFEVPEKDFLVIGRLPMCDLPMEHPSLSRYHAVIQFKSNGESFVYDLHSSHGTKLNKQKIQPGLHVPLRPGDQLRFGESTRIYLFQTDQVIDQEEEEREQVRKLIERQNRTQADQQQLTEEEIRKLRSRDNEEDAIDEDENEQEVGDDETSNGHRKVVDENAYYRKDPKKALRNYLESKGFAYEFEVEEEGPGHAREYTARIRLPIDTAMGPLYGTATTGKKRDAEREAALDACIQLDSRGMLRTEKQGPSSSSAFEFAIAKAKKADSDEDDDFYDRTKKPLGSKKSLTTATSASSTGGPAKADTHESLQAKWKELNKEIVALQSKIEAYDSNAEARQQAEASNDLDAYMQLLETDGGNGTKDSKAKMIQMLARMTKEEQKLMRLIEFTKPMDYLSKISSGSGTSSGGLEGSSSVKAGAMPTKPVEKRELEVEATKSEQEAPKKPRVLGPMRPPTFDTNS